MYGSVNNFKTGIKEALVWVLDRMRPRAPYLPRSGEPQTADSTPADDPRTALSPAGGPLATTPHLRLKAYSGT